MSNKVVCYNTTTKVWFTGDDPLYQIRAYSDDLTIYVDPLRREGPGHHHPVSTPSVQNRDREAARPPGPTVFIQEKGMVPPLV